MIFINSCKDCVWLGRGKYCFAFVDDIPNEIWRGDNDHHEPYPGDNGIQFEAKTKEQPNDKKSKI